MSGNSPIIMEDNVSIKSSDSVTTSGEYEIVPETPEGTKPAKSPTLNIANNGDFTDLEKNMHEVIHELDQSNANAANASDDPNVTIASTSHINESSQDVLLHPPTTSDMNKVGQSVFYDCIDLSPTAEKQDDMKPERSDTEEEMSDIDQDCTIFSGITYLGAATINAPKSEVEIHRNMSELNSISDANSVGLKVSVSVPSCSEGLVVLHDQSTNAVIAHYEIQHSLSHTACFAKAFQRVPQSLTGSINSTVDSSAPMIMMTSITSDITGNPLTSAEYEFIVSLEIREKVTKNAFASAPRDRSSFRLRCNTDKQVSITVKQTQSNKLPALYIERCFGVLLSPGKLVRQADMRLLDMVTMGYVKIDPPPAQSTTTATANACLQPYNIRAEWKANDKNFEKLNYESQKMYITVAVDLVIKDDDTPTDYSSDGDEPLLSGTGEVSKDCSQDTLDEWGPIIQEWDGEKRPKNLAQLVRLGVPEALRGKIWQKLCNMENKVEMTHRYRVLLTKDTKCETVIQRDIHRTFPAHKFFRETGGSGQDALFKVSKAYAVYDSELGYTQGLSFIAASLLLHMPEEEAFCVLVALMYDYGLRGLYKDGFENLYLKLYQLNRLMKDQLPKLYEHFERMGVETHMFASQWFLTIFTARFPLCFVFHTLDVFLLDGINFLFQVALTLLSVCESELRQLDFEGILKYFRITLPKKCRSSGQTRKLLKSACEKKVKKLKLYEEEFVANKELADKQEQEIKQYELKFVEERQKLKADATTLQCQLDQALEKNKIDDRKNMGIITDYKQIIQRQEDQITKLNAVLEDMTRTISKCLTCSANISTDSPLHKHYMIPGNNKSNQDAPLGPLDPLNVALQRVRELELELAQTKLAHVEAECKNQDLNHQLNTTLTEIQTNRGSWQPWLSKTINSIQEKVSTRRDVPSFQSYAAGQSTDSINTPVLLAQSESPKRKPPLSHTASLNRNSFDVRKNDSAIHKEARNSLKFRIDNTDHIIDVNKGNLQFEYDQVHIICPVYEPGTFDNETEKYIIYNVSKVEYETCRITNANPRIIAICDKPQKLMFFTITFRPFTPQPGGLEFLPGNDYYFISTSSKDDLHRRIGGRCSTNNMKVVFKVCCAPEEQYNATLSNHQPSSGVSINTNIDTNNRVPSSSSSSSSASSSSANVHSPSNGGHLVPPIINTNISNVVQSTMSWPGWSHPQRTPITTTLSVQKFNPHVTSPRPNINSANTHNNSSYSPSHKPTKKTNEYDKHPNEVVKNEELTYSNNSRTLRPPNCASLIILVTLVITFNKLIDFKACSSWCQR